MRNKWMSYRRILFVFATCIYMFLSCSVAEVLAEEDTIIRTKQGIVEIYSGFYSEDGIFHQLNHASGFLINNQENNACIVTVYNTLKNTEKKKKKYCKKNKITYNNYGLNDTIQVVVKGDVMVEAAIVTESEKENYTILQVGSNISEKTPIIFGSDKDLSIGGNVYALGFDEEAGKYDDEMNRHTEFSAMDVAVTVGTIQDTGANKDGVLYLQHSACITSGNTGGPLLDENGYVVGINNTVLSEDEKFVYYSLPISRIREILDNFSIVYQSKERLGYYDEYNSLLKKYENMLSDTAYQENSKENLRSSLEKAKNIQLNENTNISEIEEISAQLAADSALLKEKMRISIKIIIVLGVIAVVLAVWALKLLVWRIKNRKTEKQETEQKSERREIRQEQDEPDQKNIGQEVQDYSRRPVRTSQNTGEGTVLLDSMNDRFNAGLREQNNNFYDRRKIATIKDLKTGKILSLEKPETYMGKKEEMNDFVIENNSNVSRRHACIIWESGNYYIQDLQSSNGTFVNGKKIEFGNKHKLKDQDKVVLANEEFIFYETLE